MSVQKMNPEAKSKWVKALRSGEYEQTKEVLRDGGRFCVLGVLQDLYHKSFPNKGYWEDDKFYEDGSAFDIYLSNGCLNWSGLGDSEGFLVNNQNRAAPISNLNDFGYTFEELANLIEEQL